MSLIRPSSFTVACVADSHPRFLAEMVLWAHCVANHLPTDKFRAVAYFVDDCHPELAGFLADKGIARRVTAPVVPDAPHCNKIAPLLEEQSGDLTIVTDTDLFFVADPAPLFLSDHLRAAPNNHCNPPDHIFKEILKISGLGVPYRPGMSLYRGKTGLRETHINNISAGIVAVPRTRATAFGARWKHWGEWLVAHQALLSNWVGHIDQVSFTLAAEESGEDVDFLPPQVNTILHSLEEVATLTAIHLTPVHIPSFPQYFLPGHMMRPFGFAPDVCEAIDNLNECIEAAVEDIVALTGGESHLEYFLNPRWIR
jgi:hypothetical protein